MAEEKTSYTIRFHRIDIIEKHIFRNVVEEKIQLDFNVKTQPLADENEKVIIIVIAVAIRKSIDQTNLASIVCGFLYQIENFEETFSKRDDNNKIIIPPELESLLKSLSISTMRGIMYSEFRGTQLHSALLPIIPMDTLKKMEGETLFD